MKEIALVIRKRILERAYLSKSGHIGSALSVVDILTALYFYFLKIDPKNPDFDYRDRFILSKGHSANALYVILQKRGFFSENLLKSYLEDGSYLGAHPTYGHIPGIEFAAGSLGHGLSVGVGIAIASKHDQKKYCVVVVLSDGECDEGSVWEAAMAASQYRLDNLIVIVDYNKIQAMGRTHEIIDLEPFLDKWQAFGFSAREIDGHQMNEILNALDTVPFKKNKPSVIIAHTVKGQGVSFLENTIASHYQVLTEGEFKTALHNLTL